MRRVDEQIYGLIIEGGKDSYSNLRSVFHAMNGKQNEYNWLVTNTETYPRDEEILAFFESAKNKIIAGSRLTEFEEREDFQWVWGVLSGIPTKYSREELFDVDMPYADGNRRLWEIPLTIQHPLAEIEIIAFDSTATLLFSTHEDIVSNVLETHQHAVPMEEYLYSIKKHPHTRSLHITVILNKTGYDEFDHGIETSENLIVYRMEPEEYDKVSKTGVFDLINEKCGLWIDDYEAEIIFKKHFPECIAAMEKCGVKNKQLIELFKQDDIVAIGLDF